MVKKLVTKNYEKKLVFCLLAFKTSLRHPSNE